MRTCFTLLTPQQCSPPRTEPASWQQHAHLHTRYTCWRGGSAEQQMQADAKSCAAQQQFREVAAVLAFLMPLVATTGIQSSRGCAPAGQAEPAAGPMHPRLILPGAAAGG